MAEPADHPALRSLWERSSGWGSVTAFMWRRYVEEPPFGGVTMVLAESAAGEVVGSFAFLPQLVSVGGQEVRSCRPLAPIVGEGARARFENPLAHPVAGMYLYAVDALRARGDALIYMVPDPRWKRLLRMLPWFRAGSFPLYSVPLPLAAPLLLAPGDRACEVEPGDGRLDALWTRARSRHRCAVVRDGRTLPWKIWSGEYGVVGVERDGDLVGLAAAREKGDRQWLICDVLAADDDALASVLAAAVERGAEAAGSRVGKAAVLVTPAMEPVVRRLGFVRDAYDFPMLVHVLDAEIPRHDLDPSGWYVSAND
jgi:hypothetical protein